jgi:hypothetical protein
MLLRRKGTACSNSKWGRATRSCLIALLMSVCGVSVETMKIVGETP